MQIKCTNMQFGNMHKYAQICGNMQEICKKYASICKASDQFCSAKKCKKYAKYLHISAHICIPHFADYHESCGTMALHAASGRSESTSGRTPSCA